MKVNEDLLVVDVLTSYKETAFLLSYFFHLKKEVVRVDMIYTQRSAN